MSTAEQRARMGTVIISYEARRDAKGRLVVYLLPPDDGGGTYEVAGINDKYHSELAAELKALIEKGEHQAAEARASAFIVEYTDSAAKWHTDPGVEFMLRDCAYNRGPTGAARILQMALGVHVDGDVGTETKTALAARTDVDALLEYLWEAREEYERSDYVGRDESSRFWKGLVNRWNKSLADARTFAAEAPAINQPRPPVASPDAAAPWWLSLLSTILGLLRALLGMDAPTPAPTPTPALGLARWLDRAAALIGFKETGNNRGIERFIKSAKCGQLGDAWCALFVNAMLEECGIKGSRSAAARSFEKSPDFVKLAGPALGCIVTMWRGSPASGLGHVFLYDGENDAGVWGIGGNEDDGIRRTPHARNRIVGYFWPKGQPLPPIGAVRVSSTGERATREA